MPQCIYCRKTAASADFDNEHVVSRAICGTGANWTLVDRVCGECNNTFSGYEVHMYQQSLESLARTFMGPTGRGKPVNGYVEPMKLNHLYVIEDPDPLLYEGGFSLPGQFYLRPQIIRRLDGQHAVVLSNRADQQRFENATSDLFTLKVDGLTLQRQGRDYLVAPLAYRDDRDGDVLVFKPDEIRKKPTSCWLRDYPQAQRVPPGKSVTPRLAVREDGTSFVRARDRSEALDFLNGLLAQRDVGSSGGRPAADPGTQQFVFLYAVTLAKVQATVLKTGLNLVCHLHGEQIAADPVFDTLRSLVLGDPLDPARLQQVCAFSADPTDFPPPAPGLDQHRFMIDTEHDGKVRFRMRLYGHLAYTATLSPSSPGGTPLPAERVVLDYGGAGLRRVSAWP